MKKNTEHTLSQIFTAEFDTLAQGLPAPINSARSGYMEDFMLAGLPSARDEGFLQSDMQALFGSEEREVYLGGTRGIQGKFETLTGVKTIVFENGFAADSASGAVDFADDGVFYGSLRDAFARFEAAGRLDELLAAYNSTADNSGDALTAMGSAFMQDGAVVWVPAGVRLAQPLLIDNRFGSLGGPQMYFGRTLVVLGEGAEAEIMMIYRTGEGEFGEVGGEKKSPFMVDHVREIVVGRGARLRLSEAVMPHEGCSLLLSSYMRQGANSHTDSTFASLGSGFSRLALTTDLAGEDAEANLDGIYLASGHSHHDIELKIRHLSPDCRSRQLVKGVASGEATGVFSGMIFVAQGAQRTDAAQHNRNLQLTDNSRIYTRPQLEIYADDVKCSHGATIGRLDEEAIYYLRQRGLDEAEARRMQLHGFAGDIINRYPSATFRDFIASSTDQLINTF